MILKFLSWRQCFFLVSLLPLILHLLWIPLNLMLFVHILSLAILSSLSIYFLWTFLFTLIALTIAIYNDSQSNREGKGCTLGSDRPSLNLVRCVTSLNLLPHLSMTDGNISGDTKIMKYVC